MIKKPKRMNLLLCNCPVCNCPGAVLLGLGIMVLAGCAIVPPQASNMVPTPEAAEAAKPATKTLRVVTTSDAGQGSIYPPSGGVFRWTMGSAEPTAKARLTDSAFRDALINTLAQSRLFKSVGDGGNQDYEIDASVFSQQVSMAGFSATATIGVRYKLIETASKKEVWSDSLVSQCDFTGTESEGNERATRKNLALLIVLLSKFSLL
jgi:ABC-type uncharacterized transport system auxiliary subunit